MFNQALWIVCTALFMLASLVALGSYTHRDDGQHGDE